MGQRLSGRLEWAGRHGAAGWAHCGDGPAVLDLWADGAHLGRVTADGYRPDLAAAGLGDGCCAFAAWFAAPLPGSRLAVTGPDRTPLPGSPAPLPPPTPSGGWRPDQGAPLALVVDEAAPDAARDAASSAVLSHMAALRALGWAVRFTPLAEAPAALAEAAGRVRLAYLHRLRPMLALHGAVRAANPGVRVLFALADLGSLLLAREHALLGGDPAALHGLRAAEAAALAAADSVLTHSPAEAALLRAAHPALHVGVVPWAVAPAPSPPPFAARGGIGFIGNFGHPPNRDAASVLLDTVMPLVWRHDPGIVCVIAGFGIPPALAARAGPRVVLSDRPADAAAALWHRVRVTAAPLRFGAGIKGKVLDSLAHAVPCVASPIAAEGLALPGELVAADAAAMAAALLRLHADPAANVAAAAAGLRWLRRTHDPDHVRHALALLAAPPR